MNAITAGASTKMEQRRLWPALLFCALVSSGVAGIINQVVWQRALKIYFLLESAAATLLTIS